MRRIWPSCRRQWELLTRSLTWREIDGKTHRWCLSTIAYASNKQPYGKSAKRYRCRRSTELTKLFSQWSVCDGKRYKHARYSQGRGNNFFKFYFIYLFLSPSSSSFPSLPFSSFSYLPFAFLPFSSPLLSLSLRTIGPRNPAMEFGGRCKCKLLQQGPGRAPAQI